MKKTNTKMSIQASYSHTYTTKKTYHECCKTVYVYMQEQKTKKNNLIIK